MPNRIDGVPRFWCPQIPRELGEAYREQIHSKLTMRGTEVTLVPGVTLKELRQAFDKIDADYKAFEAMTAPGPQTRPAGP